MRTPRSDSTPASRRHAGYSLLELVIVVAVLGIVLAASMPVDHVSAARIDAAVEKVASDIRYAQLLAMSTRLYTKIAFDPNTDSYSVYIEDSAAPGGWSLVRNPNGGGGFTIQLGAGHWQGIDLTTAEFGSGSSELKFRSMGEPQNGAGQELLADAQSRRLVVSGRTITVVPETGVLDY